MINNLFDQFFRAECFNAYELFGSFIKERGVVFRVYAPNAYKVEVITSYNNWASGYPMSLIDERGIYEVFIDNMAPIYAYKYRIYRDEYYCHDKIDPYAYYFEKRPETASIVYDLNYFKWTDDQYMAKRQKGLDEPISIYEVHLNAFMKPNGQELSSYQDIKTYLLPYVKKQGFTHIELMPFSEYPFDGSWGYQASGFYGATSRYGTPYDLMDLINTAHLMDLKVIMDAVYTHFVKDEFSLVNYDFSPLYEYSQPHKKLSQWDTYYFDLTSPCVMSFLMSSAHFYASKYHIDGIRFDAVSHFIYYQGNEHLGVNSEGINFLKRLNYSLNDTFGSVLLIAEDSSAYYKVTDAVEYGGLGFDYKWDLGWMNDTLKYYSLPDHQKYDNHNLLTFSMAYFYNERFILPFSHDEVVHSKKTIIDKMHGNYHDKFALCKNLFVYMFMHPGKKLNFMGNEIAMFREFDETKEIDWFLLDYPRHHSFQRFFKDLNLIYQAHPALHKNEYDYHYFKWIEVDNRQHSIFAFYRHYEDEIMVCVLNLLNTTHIGYPIKVPKAGKYVEILNSEKAIYHGCDMCNFNPLESYYLNDDLVIYCDLAPYSAIIFKHEK